MWPIQSAMLRVLVFSVQWSCPDRDKEFIFILGLACLLLLTPFIRGNFNIITIITNYRIIFEQVAYLVAMRSNV